MAGAGVTQERVAMVVGLERSALSRYLRGVRPFPAGLPERIHHALDVLEAAEQAADEARQKVLSTKAWGLSSREKPHRHERTRRVNEREDGV